MTPEARHVGDPLEACHLGILHTLSRRPKGQAGRVRECIPETGDYSLDVFMQALAELTLTGYIIELDAVGAKATGLARFNLTEKGRREIS